MFGAHNSQIATLVERQTRYVMLAKVAGQRHGDGGRRVDQKRAQAAPGAVQVTHVGSRYRRWPVTSDSRLPPPSRSYSL